MHKYKKSLIFIVTLSLILSSFQFAFADQKLIYEDSQNIKPKTNSFESKEDLKNVIVLDGKLKEPTTASSIGLSDDSVDGKYSLKVRVGRDQSGYGFSSHINLMNFNSNDNLETDCFGKIKLYVKPAQNAQELKFLINDKATSSFSVGNNLKSGQWNEIEIDLSSFYASQKISSIKAEVNDKSVWYFDKIQLKRQKTVHLSYWGEDSLDSIPNGKEIGEKHIVEFYGMSGLQEPSPIENGKLSGIKVTENTEYLSSLGIVQLRNHVADKISDDRIKVSKDGRYIYYIEKDGKNCNILYKYDRLAENESKIKELPSDMNGFVKNTNEFDVNPNGEVVSSVDINATVAAIVNSYNYKIAKMQCLSNNKILLKENQFYTNQFGQKRDTEIYRYRLITVVMNEKKEVVQAKEVPISEDEYFNYLAMDGNEQKYFSYEKEQEKDDNTYIVSKYGADRTFGSSVNTITVTHTNTKGEKVTENLAVLKSSINSINANTKKDLLIVKTKPNTKNTTQNTTKSQTNETSTTNNSSSTSNTTNSGSASTTTNNNSTSTTTNSGSTSTTVNGNSTSTTTNSGSTSTTTNGGSTSTTVKSVGSVSPESTTTSSSVQTQEKYDWYAVDVNKKTATLLNFDYDNGNITNIKDEGNVAEITYGADGTTFTYRYDRLSGKIVNDESGLENVKFNIYLNTKGPDGKYIKTKITNLKSDIIDMKVNSKADTAFVKLQDHKWYMVDAKTKSARELKIDLNDPEIIYVSDDNKLYLYDANSRYMIFDVKTEEMKDIRPEDAAIDKYLVAEDGRQIIYRSIKNQLKAKYLDKITADSGQYYLLSFDGKYTYQSYKNGRWITAALGKESFEKYGMSLSEINALCKEDFNKLYINDRQIYLVDVAIMLTSGTYYGSPYVSGVKCFIDEDDMDNKLYGQKIYMAKEENISLDNVRKINGINVVESVNLPTEFIYFMKKGDKYLTYSEKDGLHEGDASIDSLLKDVRKNWIDLKLMGMTKAELINIPSEALTKEFITDATSGAAMKIVYAAKLDDGDTSKYKASFRLSTTDNYFQSENLKIVIQQNDGKTKEYANLSKVQVEDFMEWVAGRQVNQGPIFYRLKSGNTNEFINYYMIVNVTVQE